MGDIKLGKYTKRNRGGVDIDTRGTFMRGETMEVAWSYTGENVNRLWQW